MAGHAPRSARELGGLMGWVEAQSDFRISIYMLIGAVVTIALVYAVDWRYFG